MTMQESRLVRGEARGPAPALFACTRRMPLSILRVHAGLVRAVQPVRTTPALKPALEWN